VHIDDNQGTEGNLLKLQKRLSDESDRVEELIADLFVEL